jgi:hypothetical protein
LSQIQVRTFSNSLAVRIDFAEVCSRRLTFVDIDQRSNRQEGAERAVARAASGELERPPKRRSESEEARGEAERERGRSDEPQHADRGLTTV